MTIGEEIKFLRKEKGYSQQKLADLTGLARITIAQYEANKYQPSDQNLNKISDTLSVPVSYFYEDELPEIKNSVILSAVESELLSLFNSLDSTGKSKLLFQKPNRKNLFHSWMSRKNIQQRTPSGL